MTVAEGFRSKGEASGPRGAVSAHNRQAATAGIAVLAEGGTAFDAIVAMSAVTAVRETAMNGLGGGGVFLGYHADSQRLTEVNFYGRTPRELPEDVFLPYLQRDEAEMEFGWPGTVGDVSQRGALSVGVPAYVRGLETVHRAAASLPWADLLAPAQALADRGFPLDEEDLYFLVTNARALEAQEEASRLYLPRGLRGAADGPLRQPHLARTLAALRSEGADGFFGGSVAAATVEAVRAGSGHLSLDDLRDYRADVLGGTAIDYHGVRVATASDLLGGITLLTMLRIAQAVDLRAHPHNSARYLDMVARCVRLGWAARFELLSRPAVTADDLARLLSDDFAREAADRITSGDDTATSSGVGWTEPDSHTTSLAATDARGNLATITQTLGQCFGSAVAGRDTGVLLYDLTYWMNPLPGSVSSVAGWKRPSGHATPVILTRDGKPLAALGAPGGRKIVTALFQVVLNIVDFGMGVQEAIAAPRISLQGVSPVDPTRFDGATVVDHRIPAHTVAALARLGWSVRVEVNSATRLPFARPTGVAVDGPQRTGGVDAEGKSVAFAL